MSSRNYAIAASAVVLVGTGAWWVLSDKESQKDKDLSLSNPPPPMLKADLVPIIPSPPVEGSSNKNKSIVEEPPPSAPISSASVVWSKNTLEFAKQKDPDPALSGEIKYSIQKSVNTVLDPARYQTHSIECRGQRCQILLVDRSPPDERPGASAAAKVFRDLSGTSIRDPNTGLELGKPMLQSIEGQRDGGIIILIGF